MHYRSLLLQDRIVTRTESQFGGREQFTYNRNLKFTSQIEFRLTEVTEVSFRLDQISGEDYTVQENSVSVFSVGADRDLFNEHIDDDRLRTHWRRVLNPGVFRFRLEINEFSDRTGWSDHQWVLQLPSPSSASLIMLGMIGLTRRRR